MLDSMPKAKGKGVNTVVYVDSDHARDQTTRRSVSGIILYINNTPVKWISKRQRTVEASSYGSELVAARVAVETVLEYRTKLRMLGVNVDSPTTVLGDNMSVVLNATRPSSQLKKKWLACSYHRVREAIAGKIIVLHHIVSGDNLADLMTKPLTPNKHQALVRKMLFRKPSNMEVEENTKKN